MRLKSLVALFFIWLLSTVLVCTSLYQLTVSTLMVDIKQELNQHLSLSFDEALFSDEAGRINDHRSILYVGKQINKALESVLETRWYSVVRPSQLSLLVVDGITVDKKLWQGESYYFLLERNQIPRRIQVGLTLAMNDWLLSAIAIVLAGLIAAFYRLSPTPVSAVHRKWIDYLLARDYDEASVYSRVLAFGEQQLALNDQQWNLFNLLHRVESGNFTESITVITDPRILDFSELQLAWFTRRLADCNSSTDADGKVSDIIEDAWRLAEAADKIIIDLINSRLTIHDIEVPVGKTALFYYAWYASKKRQGDGWMVNPQSNKPDREQGQELAKLMWSHKGHAKAISDLEEVGLKAKTLDQNRSKIKEELVAAIGETLASHYLFETEKDSQAGRMRYRLKLSADQIDIIQ
ncbi:MAG TPA: hypothetical protein ENI05_00150 [Porticoccus sp.]|nr:hypothetical protein [Porticoccus sp.]